jgi:hypothetical protein
VEAMGAFGGSAFEFRHLPIELRVELLELEPVQNMLNK